MNEESSIAAKFQFFPSPSNNTTTRGWCHKYDAIFTWTKFFLVPIKNLPLRVRFGAFSSHSKHKIGAVKMRTFDEYERDLSSSAILNLVSSHDAKFRRKKTLGMSFRKGTADRSEKGLQRTVFFPKKSAEAFQVKK